MGGLRPTKHSDEGQFGSMQTLSVTRIASVPNSAAAHEQVRATLKEARALKEAQHENVIRLEGICVDDPQRLGVLMEYAEQGTLRQVLDTNKTMGRTDRRRLSRGILRGLAMLHAHKPRPILHGDLKATNVLVAADGTPKLADFGRASGSSAALTASMSMSRTHRGMSCSYKSVLWAELHQREHKLT